MVPSNNSRVKRSKIAVALLLTAAAGDIDVVGFIAFWHVFTAHMTGNAVHLGLSLAQGHWQDAAHAGWVIPVFLVGSVVGRCFVEFGVRHGWRRIASLLFLLEAAGITEVIWLSAAQHSSAAAWGALLLLSFIMGLQTAALTRVGPLTVHTTFVTGMLNSLGERFSHVVFWAMDALRSSGNRGLWHTRALRESAFLACVWLAYIAGACGGALLMAHWKVQALFFALAALFVAIVIDQITPLGIEEEKEQAHQALALHQHTQPGTL
jgi:uncharacterized membrane protein YoaK (UPF0700 family)